MNIKLIYERLKLLEGQIGFCFQDLITNDKLDYQTVDIFEAASIIKFPMLVVMEKLFYEGRIDPLETLIIKENEKVGGCGGLSLIPGDVSVNYRGLCNNMIAVSDNTATNKLLSDLTIELFNEEFQKLGLKETVLCRMLFDDVAKERGLENKFSLNEMVKLLADLYHGKVISPEVSQRIIDTLKMQQINHKIPAYIPSNIEIAHKTGEDENITHDIAIVYASNPYILCFASNETNVPETECLIRIISKQIFEQL